MMGMIAVVTNTIGTIYKYLFFLFIWNLFSHGSDRKIPFIIMTAVGIAMDFLPSSNMPVTVIVILLVVIPYSFFYERRNLQTACVAVLLFWDLRSISYFFTDSFTTHLFKKMLEGIESATDIFAFVDRRVAMMQVITQISYMMACTIMYLPIRKIVRKRETLAFWEFIYLAVPAVSGIALTMVMTRISVIMIPENAFILKEEKPELLWQLPLIAGLLYAAEISAIYMWQKNIDFRKQNELIAVQNAEKEALKRRLHDVEDYYESIKRVRHEMTGHLVNIRGLAEKGEYEKLQKYIEDLDDTVRSVTFPVSTGSPVLDIVIGDKASKAKEAEVMLEAKFFYKEEWGIPEYELGIVIGNLLDNAVNAAALVKDGRERWVNFKIKEKGNVIFMKCENPYCNIMTNKGKKDDMDKWHGLGLLNVKDIAERYGGGLKIEKTDQNFLITVMMKKKYL